MYQYIFQYQTALISERLICILKLNAAIRKLVLVLPEFMVTYMKDLSRNSVIHFLHVNNFGIFKPVDVRIEGVVTEGS